CRFCDSYPVPMEWKGKGTGNKLRIEYKSSTFLLVFVVIQQFLVLKLVNYIDNTL
ncbi:MAG: hypothetical protein PWP27_454, partial [Clostridiales bacterium]|nr:hypothetical protein [Clostridiales bacterium]